MLCLFPIKLLRLYLALCTSYSGGQQLVHAGFCVVFNFASVAAAQKYPLAAAPLHMGAGVSFGIIFIVISIRAIWWLSRRPNHPQKSTLTFLCCSNYPTPTMQNISPQQLHSICSSSSFTTRLYNPSSITAILLSLKAI